MTTALPPDIITLGTFYEKINDYYNLYFGNSFSRFNQLKLIGFKRFKFPILDFYAHSGYDKNTPLIISINCAKSRFSNPQRIICQIISDNKKKTHIVLKIQLIYDL